MNTHQFYNLLDGYVSVPTISPRREIPFEFLERFNMQAAVIEGLANIVNEELKKMAKLEREHMDIMTEQYKKYLIKSKANARPDNQAL